MGILERTDHPPGTLCLNRGGVEPWWCAWVPRNSPGLIWSRLVPSQGGAAGKKGKTDAVAVETKAKVVQETIIIEEGEKTLEDTIEEERAKLHREGKKARIRRDGVSPLAAA